MVDKWTNPSGGSYEDASNWNTGMVPNGDMAVLLPNFTGDTPYTVTVDDAGDAGEELGGITVDSSATLLVGAGDNIAATSQSGQPDTVNNGLIEASGADSELLLGSYTVTNYGELEATGGTSSADAVLQVEPSNLFLNLGTVVASGSYGFLELTGNITNVNKTDSGLIEGSSSGNAYIYINGGVVNNAYGVINGGVGGVLS